MLLGGEPNAIALVSSRREAVTYAELRRLIDDWEAIFRAGSRKSLVLVMGGADLAAVSCYLAVLAAGNAVLLADPLVGDEALTRLVDAFQPEIVVHPARTWSAGPLPGYRHEASAPFGATTFIRRTPGEYEPHPDLALLLLTSGSTGTPRAVRLSAGNLRSNASSIVQALGMRESDRAVTALPLHYGYGLSVLNSHLAVGASVVLSEMSPSTRPFWRMFVETASTFFAAVPSTYRAVWEVLDGEWPTGMRIATQSGDAMPPELARRFVGLAAAADASFFAMYGQTEATARMACVDLVAVPQRIGSVGGAVPGGRFRIAGTSDGTGRSGIGEVVYEGPNVMLGYAGSRRDLVLGDVSGGVLHTGDLGCLDDGYLYLRGRLKRISKIGGRRLSLDEFEETVTGDGQVAVVETGGGIVVFHQGIDAGLASRVAHACRAHGISPAMVRTRKIDRLPLTERGKTDYRRLADGL
ncbi:AMP-binding protein [Plantactinospora sp. WMMB782]|uniref:AMP-binding protein n=1 Tax=Plantactinospora sp. WMMB782 TaxID=3404121 RepID=UPI003B95AF68